MRRILVVEDEEILAATLHDILTDEGHEVFVTRNGADAFEAYRKDKPDLVLLDWMMPIASGRAFLDRVRESSLDVPVLILTSATPRVVGDQPGCTLLRKPLHYDQLLGAIDRALTQGTA